jgi:elongation factor Ts
MVDVKLIRELRERTHVGLDKCKKALDESKGDVEKAIVVLQKMGLVKVKDKARRDTKEGHLFSYTHSNGKIAVLLEVNCESDFSARNELFRAFCEGVGLQIVAMNPQYLTSGDVPDDVVADQRDIFKAQVPPGAPENKVEHIINGKMRKWYGDVCLMDQKSVVVQGNKTIEQLRADLVMQISENVIVKRFVRWELGQ